MSIATQRETPGVVDWYRANEVYPQQIGFDPDGMCLKICRTARNILPGSPSAIAAAHATPAKYRVYKVEDLRKGMVLYFDEPDDSNPHGHIVTHMGREAGSDPSSLSGIFTRTNSVVANQIVVTRASFFPEQWGDRFMFGAWWLNGEPFYDLAPKPEKPKPRPAKRIEAAIENYGDTITALRKAAAKQRSEGDKRLARALMRDIDRTIKLRDALRRQYEELNKR